MTWLDVLENLIVWALAASALFGLTASVVLFLIFHLGLRDFQDYESEA